MTERRPLTEGIKTGPPPTSTAGDPAREHQFVYGAKPAGGGGGAPAVPIERTALNTRIRTDYARTLKRVSLERQLNGIEPSTLQEILEEALEAWMRQNNKPTQ